MKMSEAEERWISIRRDDHDAFPESPVSSAGPCSRAPARRRHELQLRRLRRSLTRANVCALFASGCSCSRTMAKEVCDVANSGPRRSVGNGFDRSRGVPNWGHAAVRAWVRHFDTPHPGAVMTHTAGLHEKGKLPIALVVRAKFLHSVINTCEVGRALRVHARCPSCASEVRLPTPHAEKTFSSMKTVAPSLPKT